MLKVNGKPIRMEVDTGAAVSVVSEATYHRYWKSLPLIKTDLELQTYSAEKLPVIGKLEVDVKYGHQQVLGELYVVSGRGPSLLGRNILQHIRLDWPKIAKVHTIHSHQELTKILDKYPAVLCDQLGTFTKHKASLQLKDGATPRYFRPRLLPFALKETVERELDRLVAAGILEPVRTSQWATPIVVVPKKEGHIRLCGDYKVTINPVLLVDIHPIPKPQELFASLAGGVRFTKLDLSQAYQQMLLDEKSKELVTINTHKGLFRYTRLPFGVASAPAIFQRTMDCILQGMSRVHCYIDDILITGETDMEHLQNLEEVLRRLKEHGITVKKSKCQFLRESVEYLGHIIDKDGLHAAPSKVQAVLNAPAPTCVKELRSFLGLINYYGRFIPNLATLLHPLNQLLKKTMQWKWSQKCQVAFQEAKERLISVEVLVHYDPALTIRLATDASAYGLGAVISHVLPNGSEKPIAFASRTLSSAECNYSQIEKEALAIIFGIKKFHQYLYGRNFTLITDHKPLVTILGPKAGIPTLAAARLQRWAIHLSAYSFSIEFRGTEKHGNADGLSRLPLPQKQEKEKPDVATQFNVVQMSTLPLTHRQLRTASRCDSVVSKVMQYTKQGWPNTVPEAFKSYWRRRNEMTVEADCLLWGTRVVIPGTCRDRVLKSLHESHPGIVRMKSQARSYVWWPGLDKDIEKIAKSCDPCSQVKDDPAPVTLHPWVWPSKPWKRLHIDFGVLLKPGAGTGAGAGDDC